MKYAAILCLLFGSLETCLAGVTNAWNVGAGDWNTPGSWNNSLVPTAIDRANIDNGGTATISSDATCSNLYLCSTASKTGYLAIAAGNFTVGNLEYIGAASGLGVVEQSGGTNSATNYLVVGKAAGVSAYYRLRGGTVSAFPFYVGWGGYGEFDLIDGTVAVRNGSTTVHIGATGTGLFVQSNGTFTALCGLTIGDAGATGTYLLVNGTMTSGNNTFLGLGGYAHVRMTGGNWVVVPDLQIGYTSTCLFEALGGNIILSNTWYKILHVGNAGSGALYLGDANGTASITNIPQAAFGGSLYVRDNTNVTGLVRGWGLVGLMGTLRNNGQIIADGYGSNRDLDLSLFGKFGGVSNTIPNTSSNGWFAVNQGRLLLPPVLVASNAGLSGFTWGGTVTDATVTLVNSARLAFSNTRASSLSGALLSLDRADVPAGLIAPIGVWSLSSTGAFSTVALTFRYDDVQAATRGLSSATLRAWQWRGARWADVTQTVDTNARTVTTATLTNLGIFAIASAPKSVGSVVQIR